MKSFFLALAGVWSIGAIPALAEPVWTIEPISQRGELCCLMGIALGPEPMVATFRQDPSQRTWVASRNGGLWSDPDLLGGIFRDFSLDRELRPHVLVGESKGEAYMLRQNDDGTWATIPIAPGNTAGLSLAFDSQNRPHISYVDTKKEVLNHAVYENGQWKSDPVTSDATFFYNTEFVDLALDGNDVPHVLWYDFDQGTMEHETRVGDMWVNRTAANGAGISFAVDQKNQLHTTFTSGIPQWDLAYAMFDGSDWHSTPLGVERADPGVIAIDANGHPHIVYVIQVAGADENELWHAGWDGSEWAFDLITNWPSFLSGPEEYDLTIDEHNRAHLVYSDDSYHLYYATAVVPEPATGLLVLGGLSCVMFRRRGRSSQRRPEKTPDASSAP